MPAELSESRWKTHSAASPGHCCVHSGIFSVLMHVGTAESGKLRKSRVAQVMPPVRYTLPGALSPWETGSQSPRDLCPVPALPPTSSITSGPLESHELASQLWSIHLPLPPDAHISSLTRLPEPPGWSPTLRGTRLFHSKLLPCLPVHLTPGSSWSVRGEGSSCSYRAWQLAGARSVLAEW